MGWITILWPMMASSCLTLAAVQFVVWLKQPGKVSHLLFTVFALSIAGISATEFLLLRAQSPEQYGVALLWIHVPVSTGVISCVGFISFYFGTGRRWLGALVIAIRLLSLLLNFLSSPNLQFKEITSIEHVELFGGESVSIPHGVQNPLVLIEQLGLYLLVLFIVDASIALWKKGGIDSRRRALLIGGSLAFFVFAGTTNAVLTFSGSKIPVIVSIPFMVVVAAIGYELSSDVARVGALREQLLASEEDLRATQQRMALAADAAGLGIWTWEVATNHVWATDRCRELHGVGMETLDSTRFFARVHPDDAPKIRAAIQRTRDEGVEFRSEYRITTNDSTTDTASPNGGAERWIEARGHLEKQPGGAAHVYGVSINITELKRTSERIRLVFEAAPNALVMADHDGKITLANSQVEVVFGYRREEIIGQPMDVLLAEPLRVEQSRLWHQLTRHGIRPMNPANELTGRRKDGSVIPIEVGLTPIVEAGHVSILASIVDISARKQSEQALARQRNELAHLSRVTILGELSGSLAHELNQPLTSILSNAQAAQRFMAQANPNLDEVREILADIVSEDRRAGEVIRRLRLLLTKGEVHHTRLDANELVHDVFKLIRSDLISQGVQVKLHLALNLPQVWADRVQIQQVVLNLAVNACDAMTEIPAAERQLTVRTRSLDNGDVEVSVSDQGMGIAPDRMDDIFEPFFTTKTVGMGLGLAVCRTIIQAHGGRLWVSNNIERGATFHFVLATAKEPQQ